LPRGSIGRAISSLLLTRRASLRVATTVPTILANSTYFAFVAFPIGSASSRFA
jgi:hypothetical protein